jgi:hypothetical protein
MNDKSATAAASSHFLIQAIINYTSAKSKKLVLL